MKRSRRNHSSKFKAKIALEALRGESTLAELGSRLSLRTEDLANALGLVVPDCIGRQFYALGIDGAFSDYPGIAVTSRSKN